jgi:hypothetical protein
MRTRYDGRRHRLHSDVHGVHICDIACQQKLELPKGVGSEDQSLVLVQKFGTKREESRSLFSPVPAPVAAVGVRGEAIDRRIDVPSESPMTCPFGTVVRRTPCKQRRFRICANANGLVYPRPPVRMSVWGQSGRLRPLNARHRGALISGTLLHAGPLRLQQPLPRWVLRSVAAAVSTQNEFSRVRGDLVATQRLPMARGPIPNAE